MSRLLLTTISIIFSLNVSAVPLTIFPPSELTLDGLSISNGNFTLEAVTGFSDPGGVFTETSLLSLSNAGDDVIISATIGGTGFHTLIDIPTEMEVIRLQGFFDPTTPDLPVARFDIILGILDDVSTDAFTYFLPTDTSDFLFQITNIGSNLSSEIDNTDYFVRGSDPIIALTANDPSLAGLDVITLNNGVDNPWFVGVDPTGGLVVTGAVPNVGGIGGTGSFGACGFIVTTVQRHGRSITTRTPAACDVPEPDSRILLFLGMLGFYLITKFTGLKKNQSTIV